MCFVLYLRKNAYVPCALSYVCKGSRMLPVLCPMPANEILCSLSFFLCLQRKAYIPCALSCVFKGKLMFPVLCLIHVKKSLRLLCLFLWLHAYIRYLAHGQLVQSIFMLGTIVLGFFNYRR